MRLAVVSVFFAAFATTAWLLCPTQSIETGVYPIGPVPESPPEPVLPPEPLDAEDLAALNACANDPESPDECRVEAVRRLFTHYLRPPVDVARVSAVIRYPSWVDEADIERPGFVMAWVPNGLDGNKHPVFWVKLLRGPHGPGAWWIVRVSGLPDPTADDFRSFLRGEPGRAPLLRIEESGWVHNSGAIAHYTLQGGPYYGR